MKGRAAIGTTILSWVLLAALGALPAGAISGNWRRVEIPATGSYFWRYVPQGLPNGEQPLPVVLFFHGAGGKPDGYRAFVQEAAETTGCIVAMPKSSDLGWGTEKDAQSVTETLRLLRTELPLDERHVAVAGHSAGGAYAYLLAYLEPSHYSGVFTLAASGYPVPAVADPAYKAPIRMYYGTTDPNFTGTAYPFLKAQWNRLGIPWEEDVQAGFGHSSWPAESMLEGFRFLLRQTYPAVPETGGCVPGPTRLCLEKGRFAVSVRWTDPQGQSGDGRVVEVASANSGLFWFFDAANWELMVKVIDGCPLNRHYWVFSAATTNVRYVLTVTDTETGQTAQYENPQGRVAPAITDTAALDACP